MAKGQGRTKGSRNKNTIKQEDKAKQLGIDPFAILLMFAAGDWAGLGYESGTVTKIGKDGAAFQVDRISPELRQKSASDACQYLLPKLKSVEIKTSYDPMLDDRPLKNLTDDELDQL